jgi:simple sugar transport system substrate-binding protein
MRIRRLSVALLGAALVVSGCATVASQPPSGAPSGGTGGGLEGALVQRSDISIEVVTHGQAIDGFWGVVRNGVTAAANDMGVQVTYSAPDTESDMVRMSQLIDAAVAKQPDGLVVSIPNPEALGPAIEKAVAAGIPVISMNSGSDAFRELGVLAHVGQTEFEAGVGAGQRFKEAGVTKVACFNQEVGNEALTQRCNGFFEGFGAEGEVLTGNISDPAAITATIQEALGDQELNGVLTLGPSAATPALAALEASGRDDVSLATFDLSPDVLNAIKDGQMLFAIDQQQFIQGYLPIVFLTVYAETRNLPTGNGQGLLMTGPGFVDESNAEAVIGLSGAGLR